MLTSTLRSIAVVAALLFTLTLGACSSQLDAPRPGRYRAVLELPGGEAPFMMEVVPEPQQLVLFLVNGPERTRVDEVSVLDRELVAALPGGQSVLRARMWRKELSGTVTWSPPGGPQQTIPFSAELGREYRFYEEPSTDNADVSGPWKLTYTGESGTITEGIAVLEQSHDRVTGKMMGAGRAHDVVEGQVHGDELQLSSFDGGPVVLYKLRVNDDGDLEGDYWQGLARHARVAARRSDDAAAANEI